MHPHPVNSGVIELLSSLKDALSSPLSFEEQQAPKGQGAWRAPSPPFHSTTERKSKKVRDSFLNSVGQALDDALDPFDTIGWPSVVRESLRKLRDQAKGALGEEERDATTWLEFKEWMDSIRSQVKCFKSQRRALTLCALMVDKVRVVYETIERCRSLSGAFSHTARELIKTSTLNVPLEMVASKLGEMTQSEAAIGALSAMADQPPVRSQIQSLINHATVLELILTGDVLHLDQAQVEHIHKLGASLVKEANGLSSEVLLHHARESERAREVKGEFAIGRRMARIYEVERGSVVGRDGRWSRQI